MKKGFTLIELMVVISIISLLSSVVLGSLASARQEANNNRIVSQMIQYRNALALYYQDHGTFPSTAATVNGVCLGTGYPNGQCGLFSTVAFPEGAASAGTWPKSEDPNFNNLLKPYLTPGNLGTKKLYFNSTSNYWVGAIYFCGNSECLTPIIIWSMEGRQPSCYIYGFSDYGWTTADLTTCYAYVEDLF
jgi:prepilin-type N-terminal cleavage/methylation domain-containing protein